MLGFSFIQNYMILIFLLFKVSIKIGNHGIPQETDCFGQLKCFSFYQALFAEFLGTYLLVLFAIGFGLPISDPDVSVPEINGCLGSGLMVFVLF